MHDFAFAATMLVERGRPVLVDDEQADDEERVVFPQASVGVLPFLDLTEGMHNEEFANGMTEELVDKISKIPGLSVRSATSSLYYTRKATARM